MYTQLDRTRYASAEGLLRGAYVLADSGRGVDLILIATGSEVWVALEAFEQLSKDGIGVRLVSMPSWELFDIQSAEYQEEVLPESVGARVSLEAGSPLGWERWVGRSGEIIGLDHFGKSAEGELVLANFGFNSENVVKRARRLLERTK
jgi:transketolase